MCEIFWMGIFRVSVLGQAIFMRNCQDFFEFKLDQTIENEPQMRPPQVLYQPLPYTDQPLS